VDGCPKLADDFSVPAMLEGHEWQDAPLLKLGNQSINLWMMVSL
jgi:hypothetical protein